MNAAKTVTGILAAAAVGAAIGVLFAPDKGYKTRKRLMRKGNDFKDTLTDKINDFVDDITEQYENMKTQASDLMETGKGKANATKAESKNHVHSMS
ncbi:YtxH domain-containing protein [Ferruginibacter albus]|uniref:YtxH domain-containing protein n=1 Tax=Ferruginibacter albus TaxID=2875540 RepID=UPI001CC5F68C|nr:YtxH domain-containing protein [Ferruginibacter albus]UAY53342.1 YtxH domain-containing protein [Ferruginibacter albus]